MVAQLDQNPIGIRSVIGRTRPRKFGLVGSVKSVSIGKIGSDNPIAKWVEMGLFQKSLS